MFRSVLSGAAQDALAILGKSGLMKDAYLAGGSALALYFGHRYSIDLDFFTKAKFDPIKYIKQLRKIAKFDEDVAKGISLIGKFNGVKFSLFQYDYPQIAATTSYLTVSIAHPHDIAAMKINVVMDRGTMRDFIDLFELEKQGISMEMMLNFYDQKYGTLANNRFSIIKSLGYFDDAEASSMPRMIKKISWEEVKDFFTKESMRLAEEYL